jgi:lysophospholipase L1-like esterase
VVIGAGHNDWGGIADEIDAVMQYATANGVIKVVWLNLSNRVKPSNYVGSNGELNAAMKRWPQLRVVDWAAFSSNQPSWTGKDGVHLTAAGATAYGQTAAFWLAIK